MFTKILTRLGFTKEEISWILYDVGNSEQTLMTMTVLFPLLMAYITQGIRVSMSVMLIRFMELLLLYCHLF